MPLQNIHLRSGKVVKPRDSTVVIEEEQETLEQPINENQPRNIVTPSILTQTSTNPTVKSQAPKIPPYPEKLAIEKLIFLPEFDLEAELQNVCVKIHLLQAIKDIPIYAKNFMDLCIKKPGRKRKDPPTIHVAGQLVELMYGKPLVKKYGDHRNLIVTISINDVPIGNNLIDLGASIMTVMNMETLQLDTLQPTPVVLELVDRSRIKPVGFLNDILVTLNSWEYPVYFLVIQPKTNMVGHLVILGRPWSAIADAFVGCR
jgi:hypothetical protein